MLMKRPERFVDYPSCNALTLTASFLVLILYALSMLSGVVAGFYLTLTIISTAFLLAYMLVRRVLPANRVHFNAVVMRSFWIAALFAAGLGLLINSTAPLHPEQLGLYHWLLAAAAILPVVAIIVATVNQLRRYRLFAFHDTSDHVVVTLLATVAVLALAFLVSRYGYAITQSADPGFAAFLIKTVAIGVYPALLLRWLSPNQITQGHHSAEEW